MPKFFSLATLAVKKTKKPHFRRQNRGEQVLPHVSNDKSAIK